MLVDQWEIPGLTPELRIKLKVALLRTDAAYWRAPYNPAGSPEQTRVVQQGFSDIAEILFKSSILTPEILQNELPLFIQRFGAAAGWIAAGLARTTPWLLFRGEISEWRGRLLEVSSTKAAILEGTRRLGRGAGRGKPACRKEHAVTEKTDLEALGQKAEPQRTAIEQPTPPNNDKRENTKAASWDTIEISFLSDERVLIWNGTNTEARNYGELGFADRRAKRGKPKPNQAWVTLRAMAEQNGIIGDGAKTGRDWPKVEKRMQEIRRALRNHFGITADPIPFVERTGYQACFKIGCSPSFRT